MRLLFTIVLLSLFWTLGLGQKLRRTFEASDFKNVEVSDDWIVVKYKDQTAAHLPHKARALTRTYNAAKAKQPDTRVSVLDGIVKIPIEKDQNALEVCNRLLSDPNVLYAEPILLDRPLATVTDPLSANQYHLNNIQVFDAWDVTTGDDDITIGIIDTGIDLDHEDLAEKIWINEADPIDGIDNDENGYIDDYYGYDFADDDNDPDADESVHGVRVAGIAGAATNNDIGISGIGYNTKIAALKGFKTSNGLSGGLFDAILYAANNEIDILNLSWGSIRRPLQSEQDIIDYAVLEKNVVIVAAAGNDGGKPTEESKFYPASYEHVLSVAGSTSTDEKWTGSSFNFQVDITAPGAAIVSTNNNDGYNTSGGYGTSFAAPMVAATAALVKDQFPALSALQIMERVRATADDIYSVGSNSLYEGKLGKGRLNVYRAVTENSVKSLRAENPELVSSNGEYVFYGDTVEATFQLTNFLAKVTNPAIYITSTDDEFEVSQRSFFPGFMTTQEAKEISFKVVLSNDLRPESTVGIRLDISDGSYSDFQYLDVTTSPDYVDFGGENMSLTVEGDGSLGIGGDAIGGGLLYAGDTLLSYSGLMLASTAESVSDNIIANYADLISEDNFAVEQYYKFFHHPTASHFGYSEFRDEARPIKIAQSTIASESDDFIIIRYRIVNEGETAISNLSFGIYNDWNIEDHQKNYAEFNEAGGYLYVRNSASNVFGATKVLGDGTQTFSALDIDNLNGNEGDISVFFSDEEKYNFLVNQALSTAGSEGDGNDVAGLHGLTLDSLGAYEDAYVNVIFAVGASQVELESIFDAAEEYLARTINNPRVLEVFYTCDGANVTLDPAQGDSFEFYEDPLGNKLLGTGSSYATGTIVEDTVFYVRNADENYLSDIFAVRVQLFNDFADFSVSADTLYLDQPSVTVQFNDESTNASAWNWDFGQGSFSSLQNPLLSLNQAGTYTVSLTAENNQGCSATVSKNLVIAERPESLTFDDYQLCPGDFISISDPKAAKLKVYADAEQASAVMEGVTLDLGPFYQDTTLIISAVVNGFETARSPVEVNTYRIEADFSFLPDSSTSEHQISIAANTPEDATLLWTINGTEMGSESTVTVPTTAPNIEARLEVTSTEGCVVTIEKSFMVSTSATPAISDIQGCLGDTVTVSPSNGDVFGFYHDAELTSLIKKGTQLMVAEAGKIYVVGLDDGLPGNAVELDISFEEFFPTISYLSSSVGDKNKVEFSLESIQEVVHQKWYLNEILIETTPSPILFFDDVLATVTVEATSAGGCVSSDTVTLDFTPPIPLNVAGESDITIFPNPVLDILHIHIDSGATEIELLSLSGQLIQSLDPGKAQFDLGHLESGLYILSFKWKDGEETKFKVLKE